MELPICFILLTSFIVNINSHPKTSDIIPKDYYKRQILQPIPGYIPVYIKADGEPLVRTGSKTPISNVPSQKTAELKKKNLSSKPENASSQIEVEKTEARTGSEIKNAPNTPEETKNKNEPMTVKSSQTDKEHNSNVKLDSQKTQTAS